MRADILKTERMLVNAGLHGPLPPPARGAATAAESAPNPMQPGEFHWEMFLRGAVAALLLLHLIHLALPGARPAARAALAMFTLSLLAYVLCQQADVLLSLPRLLGVALMALCVSGTAWLWVAARALFSDGFSFTPSVWGPALAMVVLGLAAHVPRLPEWADGPARASLALEPLHGAAMLAFTGAALWEIVRGWRDDLVEPRRVARRWGAMGIGVYAAVAVVVELAVRDRPVGRLLPAVHIAGIGAVTLALAVLMARRSLDEVLGVRAPRPDAATPPAQVSAVVAPPPIAQPERPTDSKAARALERLMHA